MLQKMWYKAYSNRRVSGGCNHLSVLLYSLAEILASDLKSEPEPETYMGFALYACPDREAIRECG